MRDDHVDEIDVHPLRVFLFLLLDTLEFVIIKKKYKHDNGDIPNDDLDNSSKYDTDDCLMMIVMIVILMMILMMVLIMTMRIALMMIALMMTIMMILLMLTRPCVNRVVPPPTHLSRHSYNLNTTTCSKIINIVVSLIIRSIAIIITLHTCPDTPTI